MDIKKAWFRVIGNDIDNTGRTVTLSTRVGANSQSGNTIYSINASEQAVDPTYRIIHVIADTPETDYDALEAANGSMPVAVTLFATSSNANLGGISAELMITYTYTSESAAISPALISMAGSLSMTVMRRKPR